MTEPVELRVRVNAVAALVRVLESPGPYVSFARGEAAELCRLAAVGAMAEKGDALARDGDRPCCVCRAPAAQNFGREPGWPWCGSVACGDVIRQRQTRSQP